MPPQAVMFVTFRVSYILGSCCVSQSSLCKLCFLGLFPPRERKRPCTCAGCGPASLALVYIVNQEKQVFGKGFNRLYSFFPQAHLLLVMGRLEKFCSGSALASGRLIRRIGVRAHPFNPHYRGILHFELLNHPGHCS